MWVGGTVLASLRVRQTDRQTKREFHTATHITLKPKKIRGGGGGQKNHTFILPADHYAIYLSTSLVRAHGIPNVCEPLSLSGRRSQPTNTSPALPRRFSATPLCRFIAEGLV